MADGARRSSRFSMRSKQVGQLLLENGDVTQEQVNEALKTQETQGALTGQILRSMGVIDENQLAAALLKQVQVTDVRCEDIQASIEVAGLVPRETCEAEKLCPFERLGNLLCLVMGNPLNRRAITQIEERNGVKVKSFKAPWPKITELIERTYTQSADTGAGSLDIPGEPGEVAVAGDDFSVPSLDMPDADGSATQHAEPVLDIAVEAEAAPGPVMRKSAGPQAPAGPTIHGIDQLGGDAEMILVNKRGLTQKAGPVRNDVPVIKPKVHKVAKVNVDLDALDLTEGEVVREAHDINDESLEEIHVKPASQRGDEGFVPLKMVEDAYFYADNKAPKGGRSDELLDLLDNLPIAPVVAESIGDYDAKQRAEKAAAATEKSTAAAADDEKPVPAPAPVAKPAVAAAPAAKPAAPAAAPAAPVKKPLELEAAPAGVMTPILISEADFQRQTVNLSEDPVGEWDWNFITAGPVTVHAYDEN